MNLSIIIVNYNTKELLKKCLKSIINDQWLVANSEIIVIDNASSDGSTDYLKSVQSRGLEYRKEKELKILNSKPLNSITLRVIFNDRNLGFAKAVNQGIKKSTRDYLLFLNTDAQLNPGDIEKLIEFSQTNSQAGIIVPQLLNPDGTVQPSCFKLPTIQRAVKEFWLGRKNAYGKYTPESERPIEVEAAVGAVWLLPRTTIDKVGLFGEKYFMYFEDIDYCRRLKQAGLEVYYLPQVKIIHLHGASGKKLGDQPNQWLIESSKKYHGWLKYSLITLIIKIGQKCRKRFGSLA